MTILIIEDERRSALVLRDLIGGIPGNHQVVGILDSVDSSVTFLKAANPPPDLIFLDVQLADGSGFEIVKRVRVQSTIIICSSTADHGAAERTIGAVGCFCCSAS